MSGLSIAKSLELLLVRPQLTHEEVATACGQAAALHLAAVCVFPVHVGIAARILAGTDTRISAAVGFPYGQDTLAAKLAAIDQAQSDGADQMAVMLDGSTLLSGRADQAVREIARLSSSMTFGSLTNSRGRHSLTVVVETQQLDIEAQRPLWHALADSEVGFLQTGGGAQSRAVTEDHIQELRRELPPTIAIKAVGGIHSLEDASSLISGGAVRVGAAAALAIAAEERRARGEVQSL